MTERLPETREYTPGEYGSGEVLAVHDLGEHGRDVRILSYWNENGTKYWLEWDGEAVRLDRVTHWMPIPPLP